jgi:hypothetical protein
MGNTHDRVDRVGVKTKMKILRSRVIRREIRVGERVVTGLVCPRCILPVVIFPPADLEAHLENHELRHEPRQPQARYRRGRPPGVANRKQMSSTGVANKTNIQGARKAKAT